VRAKLLLCLILIATTPSIASATDYTGILTITVMAFIAIPWMIINLVVLVVFAFQGRYASRDFAVKHSWIASTVPILGALLALQEYSSGFSARYMTADRNIALCVYGGLLALSWLPMLAYRLTPRRALPAHDQ
jgi:ABC-type long-subunit fatty acid transport system fused permease/ATPase subunit